MITTKQLSFGYKKGHPVFNGLDLRLPQGSIVGLLGRNGEGKTTLLKNLYGQLFSKQGEIDVLGFTPRERKVSFLQQVYLLPEEIQVPRITIRRYFNLYAPFYPNYDEAIACESSSSSEAQSTATSPSQTSRSVFTSDPSVPTKKLRHSIPNPPWEERSASFHSKVKLYQTPSVWSSSSTLSSVEDKSF